MTKYIVAFQQLFIYNMPKTLHMCSQTFYYKGFTSCITAFYIATMSRLPCIMSKPLCPKVLHNYERQWKALEISFSCHVTLLLGAEKEELRTSDTTKTNSPSNIYFTLKAGKTSEFWNVPSTLCVWIIGIGDHQ